MKAYVNIRRARGKTQNGRYKIDKNHHFNVQIVGLIGKLPVTEDILKTYGHMHDLLASFQTYFLYGGEIYQLTTYSQPLD
jgi:hypothetical protein